MPSEEDESLRPAIEIVMVTRIGTSKCVDADSPFTITQNASRSDIRIVDRIVHSSRPGGLKMTFAEHMIPRKDQIAWVGRRNKSFSTSGPDWSQQSHV